MVEKIKTLWGGLLCKLGWQDWEEVPMKEEENFLGSWSYTNAECTRCSERTCLSWMTLEEARAICSGTRTKVNGGEG